MPPGAWAGFLLTLLIGRHTGLVPSPACEAQGLCTCWSNTTATQLPACYSPTEYSCKQGLQLLAEPEPKGQCFIPKGKASSSTSGSNAAVKRNWQQPQKQEQPPLQQPPPPPPQTPAAADTPELAVLSPTQQGAGVQVPVPHTNTPLAGDVSKVPQIISEAVVDIISKALTPPMQPSVTGPVASGAKGIQVAPVTGTLTADGQPATAASLPPFARMENSKTPRLIRMPAGPEQDPHGLLSRPVPTNAWWTNLMWPGPVNNPSYGEDPVQVFPYHVSLRGPPSPRTPAQDRGMWVCKPFYTGHNEGGVIMASWPELQVTLQEIQDAAAPSITALNWDDLSITMRYSSSSSSSDATAEHGGGSSSVGVGNSGSVSAGHPSMLIPLVKGSPYVTVQIPVPAQPVIRVPGAAVGGGVINSVTRVTPNKIRISVGAVPGGVENNHTWVLWGSKPFSHTLAAGSIHIQGSEGAAAGGSKYSGVLRLAWVPEAATAGAAAIEALLDRHVDTVPIGGSVSGWFNKAAGTVSYSLSWATQSMSGAAAAPGKQLLMLALPHHIDTLASPAAVAAATGPGTGSSSTGDVIAGAAIAAEAGQQQQGLVDPALAAAVFPSGVEAAAATGSSGSSEASSGLAYTSKPHKHSGRPPLKYGAYVMSVRGPLVPVVGSSWVLEEQVTPLKSEEDAAAHLKNPTWRADIERSLLADLSLVLPPSSLPPSDPFADWPAGPRAWPWKGMMNMDAYFGGSEMQAMARLMYIAQALSDTPTAAATDASFAPKAAAAAAQLANALGLLLKHKLSLPCTPDASNPGALCYDAVFKLVTTARALNAVDDSVDFFSRTGTDHHFHYGYWVAAAAAVASHDLAWYRAHLEPAVKALVRDFANNDRSDPVLPFARHKDWYMGHSWASGLQPSADGKNQESSSEAVNAYAAVAQLGRVTGDPVLEGWGQLLLSTEVTAAHKYTQVFAGNDVYQQVTGSAANGVSTAKVAAILFGGKASTFNWFDPDILTRHAIQWMPFSPVSNSLLQSRWLQESVHLVSAGTSIATNRYWSPEDQGGGALLGWRVLLAMAQAMVPGQQAAAWEALAALPLDASDGFALCGPIGRLTRTAAKWWIATRP